MPYSKTGIVMLSAAKHPVPKEWHVHRLDSSDFLRMTGLLPKACLRQVKKPARLRHLGGHLAMTKFGF